MLFSFAIFPSLIFDIELCYCYGTAKPDSLLVIVVVDKDPVEEEDKVDVEKGHGEGGANKSPSKLQ